VQLYLEPETRFWERDGLPPDMWTDTALERIFAVHDRETRAPNGLLVAWVNGAQADWTRGLPDAEIEAKARAILARMRPASEGRVRLRKVVRWTDENTLAGGAYMHWAPGQIGPWADVMGAPAGRIHFAGEHLSRSHTGLEGAMESAEIAAEAIVAAANG
jgi:monoamine oxidase